MANSPSTGAAARGQRYRVRTAAHPVNKTKIGGGFNPSINPSVNINLSKGGGAQSGASVGGTGVAGGPAVPGGDFMSNEDIRAWCEHIRKDGRRSSIERTLDAEHLETVLKHIRDSNGSMAGASMRARRVSRHAKKIARAEAAKAKAAAALYAQFEKEFEPQLRTVNKARPQRQRQVSAFGWA